MVFVGWALAHAATAIVFLFTGSIPGFAAETAPSSETACVWVVFSDKRLSNPSLRSVAETEAARWITTRAQSRRALRGVSNGLDESDFAVPEPYIRAVEAVGIKKRAVSRWFNALSVEATKDQIAQIAQLPFVAQIEPVRKAPRNDTERTFATIAFPPTPSPPSGGAIDYGPSRAQLEQINAIAAHQAGYDGTGVLIGIIDTGFYKGHEAFASRVIVAERDFVFNDNDVERDLTDPNDYNDSHGTAVWSALGGFKDGSLIGAAYGATFLLAKTEDLRSETPLEEDYWVAAIEWMEALGVDVVNSSLGYIDFDGGVGDYLPSDFDGNTAKTTIAADRAATLGVVVCTSAGNGGPAGMTLTTPADANLIIACGAVRADGSLATSSSRGPTYDGRIKPEVCAMGVGVTLATPARPGVSYGSGTGTSFSSPLVGGAAALVLQAHPDWGPVVVRQALMATADNAPTPNNNQGWGVIDVMAAINYPQTNAATWRDYD